MSDYHTALQVAANVFDIDLGQLTGFSEDEKIEKFSKAAKEKLNDKEFLKKYPLIEMLYFKNYITNLEHAYWANKEKLFAEKSFYAKEAYSHHQAGITEHMGHIILNSKKQT